MAIVDGGARWRRVGFWTLAVLAVLIAVASLRVLTFDPMVIGDELRQNLLDHPWTFWTHAILGPIALLLGIFQFIPTTRRTAYHRWAGRVYVFACLVGAVAGFSVAFTTAAGPVAAAGFVILAVLWASTTMMAYVTARRRDFVAHRRWMVRSYSLTAAAITLRLILLLGAAAGLGFMGPYVFAAWASWIINLAIGEAIIRRRPQPSGALRPADFAREAA